MPPTTDLDALLHALHSVRNAEELNALLLQTDAADLDALEAHAAAQLDALDGDEAAALRERLDALRELRSFQQQLASLDPDEQVLLAFTAAQNPAEIMTLVARTPDDLLDALEPHAGELLAAAEGDEAEGLQRKLDDLRSWRTTEAEARARLAGVDEDALAQRLIAWIQQPDWDASQRFLMQHADLLAAAAAAAMTLLWMANAGNDDVQLHHNLLAACRAQGIDAAYARLHQENRFSQQFSTPVGQAVLGFVAAESDEAARQLLHAEALLLTADAQRLLTALIQEGWIDADAQPQVQQRLAQRLAQWHEAWRARAGGPRRSAAGDDPRQPDPEFIDRLERQPLPAERAPRYHIVTAINSAIGPGASVLNIYEVGALPLAWRTPQQTRPDLARSAVGRAAELEELHRRLCDAQGGGVALVGMRGIAGIGKTWLAALYATTHAAAYPGGVIWIDVGPRVRRKEEVTPLLQKLAAHAYAGDVRVAWLDEIVFAADAVQLLLSGHGRLLLIFDDVWSDTVAETLRAAAPADSAVLLTTRDRRVAYALGHGPDAIQELDVLTLLDARALLQRRAPGLGDALADTIANGLGRHALALDLAGAALFERGPARHQRTAAELLRRVAEGRGFGDLPLEDRADAESNVEIILRYTYDYLGEDPAHGASRQAGLRALGTFAQEASFDTAAAAALWQCPADAAEARLLLFDQLALVQATGDDRWRQHAILRAYAYSLQTSDERLALPQRHADYLWEVVARSIPADTERVAREFDQVEHSFGWCRMHSPARAARLAARVSQVMMIRGRAQQAGEWLAAGQEAARASGDRGNQANTLQSLGDLERRLGNIDAARRHYDAALPLFEAEQARLGKANTLKSLGDLESRLGNIDAARRHYDAALPLYEAEQARLGKANTLQSLGDLERRLGNIDAARRHYDAALPLYEAEQARLGKANTLKSLGDLESRLGNIDAARRHYDAALPLYEAEQARLGKANTLQSLGDLESRLGNIDAARRHYDAALPLFEAEQARLGKANTLQSLGDLESRLGNIDAARRHYDAALPLFEAEQARLGKANTLKSLGDLERRLGNIDAARRHYDAALPLFEAEQARLGKANTLQSLGDLESRLGNIDAARRHYDAALPLFEAEQARLGKANTLQSLGDLESRLGNIDAARRHYDAALPLFEAEQARLGKANTLKSLGDLERRLGNIDAARRHYDAALPLYEAEQARLGKANTLQSLGDLESRLGNIDAARRHYDAALPLYEAEQARLGKANTLKSLGDLESRLGNIDAARRHYDAALPLYEAEQARLGKANTLQSLGDLERRLGNIDAARRHYDAALPLYEAEQARLGKANTLQSLGDLERRLGNIDAARRHYDAALPLFEAEQDPVGKMNVFIGLARLEASLGNRAAADAHYQHMFAIAESIGFGDHPVTQNLRQEYAAFRQQENTPFATEQQTRLRQLADLLVAWMQLDDLNEQDRFLTEHAADLLTDEGEQALQLLVQANDNHPTLVQAQPLLARCRAVGVAAAYAELRAARDNPLLSALAALLAVADDASLRQALIDHPVLAQPQAALTLGALLGQALAAEDAATVSRLVVLFGVLLEQVNHAATNDADIEVQAALVDLCDQVIALAAQIDDDLADGLRTQTAWACNTLGNAHAQRRDPADAVAAYTRGLGFDPAIAMLLRNRAGEQIELNALDAARADIEQAAHLEPGAPRLPLLWCDYYAALGDGAAMQPYLAAPVIAPDRAAEADYRRAIMHTLLGDHAAAHTAMLACATVADDDLHRDGAAGLQRLARRHAHLAAQWAALTAVLGG